MWVIENSCPECKGNMVLTEEGNKAFLQCEECAHNEVTSKKDIIQHARDVAVEYGPEENRKEATPLGKLFINEHAALSEYLRDTLRSAVRGVELEDYDIAMLQKWGFIEPCLEQENSAQLEKATKCSEEEREDLQHEILGLGVESF